MSAANAAKYSAEMVKLGDNSNAPSRRSLMELLESEDGASALAARGGAAGLLKALGSDANDGVSGTEADVEQRTATYGANFIEPMRLKWYYELLVDSMKDATMIMLCAAAVVSLVLAFTVEKHNNVAWIEGVAIIVSVFIVSNVTAGTDYMKQFQTRNLNAAVADADKKVVVRGGARLELSDKDIVVGDVVEFKTGEVLPADGVLLRGADVRMNESSLTGEPKLILKEPEKDAFLLSGTDVMEGNGRFLVLCVGDASVGGQIRAQVYGDDGAEASELEAKLKGLKAAVKSARSAGDPAEEAEVLRDIAATEAALEVASASDESPLFTKLDKIAIRIGYMGMVVAAICFFVMLIMGVVLHHAPASHIVEYFITAITILVVAVPEGLPLAVTLSLQFSVYQMEKYSNLVKHLDACETMGSATTICSDKTGTLTTNRMTVRAAHLGGALYEPAGTDSAGAVVAKAALPEALASAVCQSAALNSTAYLETNKTTGIVDYKGNPTECAILGFAKDVGADYAAIRAATAAPDGGRGGKQFAFSSARKMMSWLVPGTDGAVDAPGYTIHTKGASEMVLSRCTTVLDASGKAVPLDDAAKAALMTDTISVLASKAMRTIALAYRTFPAGEAASCADARWDTLAAGEAGSAVPTFEAETGLTLVGIVGIEDPLRDEVPGAIARCYQAGIDVRMVTGDNLDTAVAIASQCGILRGDVHFVQDVTAKGGRRLKTDRAMTGPDFRRRVHDDPKDGEGDPVFNQASFDLIWPRLRVLARSSPQDKLTLAKGLNRSMLYADADAVRALKAEGISIFPDRQVVAMTGDGTNDAPALKAADIGFAMGIAGTTIAKDACDIILLDDNFSSIVTAAMWGRNVYDSIAKFLQFQLTVNISAITVAVIGAFAYQESPLKSVQMLWINLIMDSLASLALATEPPSDKCLDRPPYNRSQSIVSPQMWYNMLGHSLYQVIILVLIMFAGTDVWSQWDMEDGHLDEDGDSVHYTFLFNVFTLMQLFNELNSRKLEGEANVFKGILANPIFCAIVAATMVLQVILVQFGGIAFKCAKGGLNAEQWMWSIIFGLGVLPWQQVVNLCAKHTLHLVFKGAAGGDDETAREASSSGSVKFGSGRTMLPTGSTGSFARKASIKIESTGSESFRGKK